MAPAVKKPRRSIGPMLDTIVPETQNEANTNNGSDSDESFSDNNSGTNDTTTSPSDDIGNENGDDEPHVTEDDANSRGLVRRGQAKVGYEWGTGKVLVFELDSENNVVGNNAAMFSSQLGIMAKDGNKLPLSYTDWRAVPNIQKDLVWAEVKDNTNLTDGYKKNCMKKLGKLWKDWKNRLKAKFYTPSRYDKSGVLSKCPPRVEADQWPLLVNHWRSNGAKKLSKANRNSRKHVQLPPRMGRKDMACAKEEFRREHGKEPSKIDLFIYSRNSKVGKPLDTQTEEKIAKLKELKRKLPDELVDDIDANDEIFEQVIGREAPGCLRGNNTALKSKNSIFTSREDFDRAVQEKCSEKVESIEKKFEEQISKFKDEYFSQMEMLQSKLHMLEDQNIIASSRSTFSSRRIQAPNKGLLLGANFFESTNEDNGTDLEREKVTNNSDKDNTREDAPCTQEQGKSGRKSNRRKEK